MSAYEVLEKKYSEWLGYSPGQAVACASGTAALHLALEALQLPPGSTVLVPEYTMVACARAVTMAGLVPVFIDCGDDLLLDTTRLTNKQMTQAAAIMPVHVYGRCCDMSTIATLAEVHGMAVVEDLAEAHGINPHPATAAACWSFYQNKIVAGAEGGMVIYKDPDRASLARQLRSLGFTDAHNFMHVPRGVNARLSNPHANLILSSLANVQTNLAMRMQVCDWYNQYVPNQWHLPPRLVCWVYDLCLPSSIDTARLVNQLNDMGIAARLGFKPMSEQPEYNNPHGIPGVAAYKQYQLQRLNAYRLSRRVIYLPIKSNITQIQVEATARALVDLATAADPTPR